MINKFSKHTLHRVHLVRISTFVPIYLCIVFFLEFIHRNKKQTTELTSNITKLKFVIALILVVNIFKKIYNNSQFCEIFSCIYIRHVSKL